MLLLAWNLLGNEFARIVQNILESSYSAIFLAPSPQYWLFPKSAQSMRRFQRVQKLVCWSKQMLFYDTWKFLSIFENWNIFNLGLTQSSKLHYNLWFREVLRAVKGKYGQGNIHTWVWNKNYPVLNQNYWSDTVNLNWASVAIFLTATVYVLFALFYYLCQSVWHTYDCHMFFESLGQGLSI